MFSDSRSKKLALVSHCILNQNAISDSTADFPSQYRQILDLLVENHIGIIQLRCPELMCLGLNRQDDLGGGRDVLVENSRIRRLLEERGNIDKLRGYADDIKFEVCEYLKHGFTIVGIIGVNRSPSCGIETTTRDSKEVPGYGVFMCELKAALETVNIALPMVGTKTGEVEESVRAVKKLIGEG